MNLLELVALFRGGHSFNEFCQINLLDSESEVIMIHIKKPFGLESDLGFFESEKTDDKIEYVSNGETYFYLFEFSYFLDAIEEYQSAEHKQLTDDEVASHLLHYGLFDA